MQPRVSAVLLALALPAIAQASPPKEGRMHPDLRLPTIDGKSTITLSELRGKKVLLIEFASW